MEKYNENDEVTVLLETEHPEITEVLGFGEAASQGETYFLIPGTVLHERYVIGTALGFGGFGITYKAWDKTLEAVVVIKEYYYSGVVSRQPGTQAVEIYASSRSAEYRHFLDRFIEEARYVAKFGNNKNIVNVFDYFEANNTAYMVMEFLDGITLSTRIKQNAAGEGLPLDECIEIMRSLCTALKTVHDSHIIHRDISPDNIFLCKNGDVKLIDFGAARFTKKEDQEIKKLTQVIKPGFSPPEQYQSVSEQGPWTDIYALGATLYYMVTGQKPAESTNRKIFDNLTPPKKLNDSIPGYINDTILRAMAVDTHLRFASAAKFEAALTRGGRVLSVEKERRRRRKNRVLGILTAVFIIGAAFGAFWLSYNQQMSAGTLPDGAVELWYSLPDTDADAKTEAFESVVSAFNEGYPNVTVDLKAFPEAEYVQAIYDAYNSGALPNLFESTDISDDVLGNAENVIWAMRAADKTDALLIDNFEASFPEAKRFPLGFTAPAVFTNTAFSDGADDGAETSGDKEAFMEGSVGSFLGTTADYFDVQQALPARYALSPVAGGETACQFAVYYSIGQCDRDQLRIAERFLAYMLSEIAQDYLHIQYQSGALPLSRTALFEGFVPIYEEFDAFFENIDDYTVSGAALPEGDVPIYEQVVAFFKNVYEYFEYIVR